MRKEIEALTELLRGSVHGPAWHGPALMEAALEARQVEVKKRLFPAAHSIWEIMSHASVWTRVVRKRLIGERVDSLPPAEDWPASEASQGDWIGALDELVQETDRLAEVLAGLDDSALEKPVGGQKTTVRETLHGLMQHNTYHAGQIAFLTRCWREKQGSKQGGR